MSGRDVWVTGIGGISAAGADAPAMLDMLLSGRSGVRHSAPLAGSFGGVALEPPVPRVARRLDRSARLFVTAAAEAWQGAGLDGQQLDRSRCAVIEGSSLGPLADILRAHHTGPGAPPRHRPSELVKFMVGAGGASIAHALGIQGAVLHLSAGSVSAACAIGEGFERVASGQADVVLAGGAECPLQPEVIELFRAAGLLAESNGTGPACRPFDERRSGTVLGEGAGALVLEAGDHARRRGAVPRAVLCGYGFVCESYSLTAPEPDGAGVAAAVEQALSGISRNEIGWIKTHGTGTRAGDAAECRGLSRVFGRGLEGIPLVSLKPALGHCLGGSAAVEAVVAVQALERGVIPPTLGTERVDPELPPCQVATCPTRTSAPAALMLAESFGGRCVALTVALP